MAILQAWPRIYSRVYREQIQLAVRAGLELGAPELQVQRSNHSATLPPNLNTFIDINILSLTQPFCRFIHSLCKNENYAGKEHCRITKEKCFPPYPDHHLKLYFQSVVILIKINRNGLTSHVTKIVYDTKTVKTQSF